MEKASARNQTLEQRHERRKQVVRWYKKGIKLMQVVAMTGVSYPTVRAVINGFDTGSWSAMRPAVRGRARGRQPEAQSSAGRHPPAHDHRQTPRATENRLPAVEPRRSGSTY